MPSDTFFRLPDSKRARIMEAIKEEIARTAYEEFSINNVIRSCNISRGSFYQYFRNKEDIYLYLLYTCMEQFCEHARQVLEKTEGDYFASFDSTFRFAVRMLCYKDSRSFRYHLLSNVGLHEQLWRNSVYSETLEKVTQQLLSMVNTDRLHVQDQEELRTLSTILMTSAFRDAAMIFTQNANEAAVIAVFDQKLRLMRRRFEIED